MPTLADLKAELDDAITLRLISSAFTEASAAGVQKIKGEFELNRQFYDDISHVYHLVRIGGDQLRLGEKKAPMELKVLSVALTSNQRFYGNLNVNIMRGFLEETAKVKTDIMVIGLTGNDFMRSQMYAHPYMKIQWEKDQPTIDEVRAFIDKTGPYDQVLVYFPKFVSLVTQTVGVLDITQAINPQDQTPEEEIHIIFEPEYDKILDFFKRQVRNLLLMHVLLEASLSRTSARLLTMSAAEERSGEIIKQTRSQIRKIQLSISNARLLETFAGIGKWKKKKKKH